MHLDQLVFLLLVGIAFFFQLLARAAKASKGPGETKPRSTPPPIPRAPVETDEDRIRRFLEALGQPTTSKPPSPVTPRPTYQKPIVLPHVPPFGTPLPPLTTRPPELPREAKLPTEPKSAGEPKVFRPRVAEAPTFEVHEGPTPTEPPPIAKKPAESQAIADQQPSRLSLRRTELAALLRSTSGLREAIVLREIFGPPRSMQPFDLTGSVWGSAPSSYSFALVPKPAWRNWQTRWTQKCVFPDFKGSLFVSKNDHYTNEKHALARNFLDLR
jgi:hypothetical protein